MFRLKKYVIGVIVLGCVVLMLSSYMKTINYYKLENDNLKKVVNKKDRDIASYKNMVAVRDSQLNEMVSRQSELSRGNFNIDVLGNFVVTAYDLSIQSCSRSIGDKNYGITRTGYSLVGLSWDEARTVSVDPNVVPIGSRLYLGFPKGYEKYTGIYFARDTGNAVKGNKIDLFLGDFGSSKPSQSCKNFGKVKVSVYLLR